MEYKLFHSKKKQIDELQQQLSISFTKIKTLNPSFENQTLSSDTCFNSTQLSSVSSNSSTGTNIDSYVIMIDPIPIKNELAFLTLGSPFEVEFKSNFNFLPGFQKTDSDSTLRF